MQLQVSNQVGQRQSLVVTAQLQQAIHLLQMGNNDLQSYIEKEAEENPFVDVKLGKSEANAPTDRIREQRLPSSGASDDFDYIGTRVASAAPSLYEHIAGQFDMMFDTVAERALAEQFLEAIEPSGWLGESLANIAAQNFISEDEAEHMLFRVQQVEPAGLFARNLAECLALQAEDKGILSHRFQIILEHLPMLANADLKGLSRVCKCSMDELKVELRNIRSLNPKPGADFDMSDTVQRAPDLLVSKGENGWLVDLNRSTLPSVVVDEKKAANFGKCDDEGSYVGERLSVARWLRRAVEHRNMTTIKVGAEVVRRQSDFLEKGPAFIKPMILKDVAEAIGVHESTVSRVTTGMLIATPQGTFPLKSFFSASLAGKGDEDGSAAAVRHRIQQLVKNENPKAPLSDDALAKMITDEGTHLARRTVAKYREMLNIPSSFQRKRQAKLAAGMH